MRSHRDRRCQFGSQTIETLATAGWSDPVVAHRREDPFVGKVEIVERVCLDKQVGHLITVADIDRVRADKALAFADVGLDTNVENRLVADLGAGEQPRRPGRDVRSRLEMIAGGGVEQALPVACVGPQKKPLLVVDWQIELAAQ